MPFKNCDLCICEICNCGRHHCPHRSKIEPFGKCVLSEYRNQYVPHAMDRVLSCKPTTSGIQSDQPLSNETTNRVDYVPHPLDRRLPFKPSEYIPPEGDMDTTTMYRKDYIPKPTIRPEICKPKARRVVPEQFDGTTNYKNDYRKWNQAPPTSCKRIDNWVKNDGTFDGIPTYTTDYVKHKIDRPKSTKPESNLFTSDQPMSDETLYRQNYVPHPLPLREPKSIAKFKINDAPFDAMSTHRRDYVPKTAAKLASFKPAVTALACNDPMANETTNRCDYVPWPLEPTRAFRQIESNMPEGEIELLTSYNKDYTEHAPTKTESCKPKVRLASTAPFEGATNYRDEYRPWKAQRVDAQRPPQSSWFDKSPFDGQSIYTSAYVPYKNVCRLPPAKAQTSIHRSDQPFDDTTLYRQEYTAKFVKPCPAALLDTSASEFDYIDQDDTGHKFYHPLSQISRNHPNMKTKINLRVNI